MKMTRNMNRFTLIGVLVLSAIAAVVGCKNDNGEEGSDDIDPKLKIVEGFTFENFPRMDGSTGEKPLNILIACKLLGIKHQWVKYEHDGSWGIEPILKSKSNIQKFEKLVKTSQTHQSIINLIDEKTDIIFVGRKMSPDEKTHAYAAGVTLIETPIAIDALDFIVNPDNPIASLTVKQIQDIYTGKITYWNEVVEDDFDWGLFALLYKQAEIQPYVRNRNSGSQELMETLVMKDLDITISETSDEVEIQTMYGALEKVTFEFNSICYTPYYYKEFIFRDSPVKGISIEGIYPKRETLNDKSYPLTREIYAVIRSNLDTSSTAYKLYELLQKGKEVINETGFLPN